MSDCRKHRREMKGMKVRLLKKLKSIPTIDSLKQSLVPQLNPSEIISKKNFKTPPVCIEDDHRSDTHPAAVPGIISVSKHNEDPDEEELELSFHVDDKESLAPTLRSKDSEPAKDDPSSENNVSSFQWRNVDSTLMEHSTCGEENEMNEEFPSLSDFEAKCPPGGADSIVLYTTSLRGIRKTFEDCNTIQFLLKSFRVVFHKRDVSMHLEFRDELWRVMGGRLVPPRLYIKGRYIGGADEVVTLHEQGKLRKLLQGIPLDRSNDPCKGCAGVGFLLCLNCDGSCKVFTDEGNDELFIRCPDCNENGLVKCPSCL